MSTGQLLHDSGTIQAIPERLLSGPARMALEDLACRDHVYVYRQLGHEPEDLTIWLEAFARLNADHDGRVQLSDFSLNWQLYHHLCTSTQANSSGAAAEKGGVIR